MCLEELGDEEAGGDTERGGEEGCAEVKEGGIEEAGGHDDVRIDTFLKGLLFATVDKYFTTSSLPNAVTLWSKARAATRIPSSVIRMQGLVNPVQPFVPHKMSS